MKISTIRAAGMAALANVGFLTAQVESEAPIILGSVADGTPAPPPPPPPPLPAMKVEQTFVRQLADRKVTIHRVKDPGLPPLPDPPEATPRDLNDPEFQAWMNERRAEWLEKRERSRLVFLSATVFDHERTFLRWWVTGYDGGPPQEFKGWSNVDFNHFCGVGAIRSEGIDFHLFMSVGNMDTERWKEIVESRGGEYFQPEPPEFPEGEPAFILTGGDPSDATSIALAEGFHQIYENEKERLVAAYEGRERARKEHEAWLKANPPQPQDVVVHFWRGKRKGGDR